MPDNTDLMYLRRLVAPRLATLAGAREAIRLEKDMLRSQQALLEDLRTALALAQNVAISVQEDAHRKISDVVSRSLAAVFDDPYEFKIIFEQKRGRTEASLVFERNGKQIDPVTAAGGGAVDVAAFALRVSCLMLARPERDHVLVLDEPFRFVSVRYRGRVRDLVVELSEELGIQFIIVTHLEEFQIGKVVRL